MMMKWSYNTGFTAKVGHVTAFVGLSGAGKTTLPGLLPDFMIRPLARSLLTEQISVT